MNLENNIKSGFTTPNSYFEDLESKIMNKITLPDSGFKVPNNYFEDNSKKLENLIHKNQTPVIQMKSNRYWITGIAAVFLLSIISPMFYNQSKTNEISESTEIAYLDFHSDDINEVELIEYLDEQSIEELENELIYNNL
jgi:hypothetical protein